MIWIPLLVIVVSVSIMDIRTRFVSPLLIVPLVGLVLGGWLVGMWPVDWIGGLLAFIGIMADKLPLGDVFAFALCGLLVGPMVALAALAVCSAGLLMILLMMGHRWSLVQHPFFPYLGAMTVLFFIFHFHAFSR